MSSTFCDGFFVLLYIPQFSNAAPQVPRPITEFNSSTLSEGVSREIPLLHIPLSPGKHHGIMAVIHRGNLVIFFMISSLKELALPLPLYCFTVATPSCLLCGEVMKSLSWPLVDEPYNANIFQLTLYKWLRVNLIFIGGIDVSLFFEYVWSCTHVYICAQ